MSRLGIVCGSLVIIGLLAEFWLAAKLGYRRGEVADKLREVTAKSEKAIVEFDKSAAELRTAKTSLAALKLGWGHEYTFAAANPASVQNQGGRLFVTGLGSATPGLELKKHKDADGQETMVPPPLHVFAANGQGKFNYIGEFQLGIGPNELGEQACVLYPTWSVSPQEIAAWDFSHEVRLRTHIPSGRIAEIDSLNQTIQRSNEQLTQLNSRTDGHQAALKEEADLALQTRRNELLGDPAGADVAERPEFKVGLVQAIEDTEEERNAIQVAVDAIRRRILQAAADRASLVENVKETAASQPKSVTKVSTVSP